MNEVAGTRGYSDHVDRYAEVTEAVSFDQLHAAFLDLIPTSPSRILDVGAGTGRDAAVLAGKGHRVTAVEPCSAFRAAGTIRYGESGVRWIDDALPGLENVAGAFDFILASAVWHHLRPDEQKAGIVRIAELVSPGGVFALSLRNGPAGVGKHVFPTRSEDIRRHAELAGLVTLIHEPDQPSLLPGRPLVRWARLAFAARA